MLSSSESRTSGTGQTRGGHLVQFPPVSSEGLVAELGQDVDALRLINPPGDEPGLFCSEREGSRTPVTVDPAGPCIDDLPGSWVWEPHTVTQRHGLSMKSQELLPGLGP